MNHDQGGVVTLSDRLAGDLLDRLNECVLPEPEIVDNESEAILRSYLEIVGILPYELDPLEPSPAAKRRLMARLSGDVGSRDSNMEEEVEVPSVAISTGGWRSWALPLAAGLCLALLGVSGWQRVQIQRQHEDMAQLSGRLRQVNLQSEELIRYRQELGDAQAKLAVLSASGVEVCSLHPMEAALAEAPPTATLFVAPDHQHWYLRIDGLESSSEGREYQLWFITDEGAQVSAGTFDSRPGDRIELTAETMPGGTIAVSVTVEPLGGSSEPSGPPLLYGDEVMRIL